MNGKTHKIGGICAGVLTSTFLFANNLDVLNCISSGIIIAGASIGSISPDIDHPESKVGRKLLLKPISITISKLFGHRTITHSLLFSIIMSYALIASASLFSGLLNYIYLNFVIGFCVGWISHLLLDLMTVRGIPIYYPLIKKKYNIFKFKTNKDEELVSILTILFTGVAIMMFFNSGA